MPENTLMRQIACNRKWAKTLELIGRPVRNVGTNEQFYTDLTFGSGSTLTWANCFRTARGRPTLTTPSVSPYITLLVSYGHLLIGLSLLVGLMVRVSAAFGIALVLMYWTAHMDWPFIENKNNFIVDYHIVYAGVLVFLIGKHAGHVWGLDGWVERLPLIARHPSLRPLVA